MNASMKLLRMIVGGGVGAEELGVLGTRRPIKGACNVTADVLKEAIGGRFIRELGSE